MPSAIQPARLRAGWLAAGAAAVVLATIAGLSFGAVSIQPWPALIEVLDHLPGIKLHSGLSARHATIVWELRFPRVVLGLLVGAVLSSAGAAFQGAFRNPLVDPYLLGVAAGAGLGATVVLATGGSGGPAVPAAAFIGALLAVFVTYTIGASGRKVAGSTASLVLAGVAVTSFLTALQTYVQQRSSQNLRAVYSWILGRLSTTGWSETRMLVPYALLMMVTLMAYRRVLNVMSVGEDEAQALGLDVRRARMVIVIVASLGTAAAVSVSGLIGFVGIIVPHTIRLIVGTSYRVIVPLAILFGGAFVAFADIAARTIAAPAELPIGVITAFVGAPFFVMVLRTSKRSL